MKPSHLAITMAAMTLLAGTSGFAADKTEKNVALRVMANNRYVTSVPQGRLDTSGKQITSRQTFVLVDLNGGEIAEGDDVLIKWAPSGTRPTYLREGEGNVQRSGNKPDAACTFKIKLKEKSNKDAPQSVVLQTASGKFVSVPSAGAAPATTETQDNAATLEIVDVPKADDAGKTATTTAAAATATATATVAATTVVASTPTATPPTSDQKPRLWLIGDSTVNNGTPGQKGWGSVIGESFDTTKINVSNRARGGRSSRTFLTEGLWDAVLKEMKSGDFVLMQFGHNDGGKPEGVYPNGRASLKGSGDETREVETKPGQKEVVHTYGWYLRKYIEDAKAKGATPIVLSMIPRNDWKEGKVLRASGHYGKWAKEAAETGGALFVDLNGIVANHYEVLGQDKVKEFFPSEHTHTNEAGARLNAQSVVEGLRALPGNPLGPFLKAESVSAHTAPSSQGANQ
jgi:rhamnogalacturonan acetylesterase